VLSIEKNPFSAKNQTLPSSQSIYFAYYVSIISSYLYNQRTSSNELQLHAFYGWRGWITLSPLFRSWRAP